MKLETLSRLLFALSLTVSGCTSAGSETGWDSDSDTGSNPGKNDSPADEGDFGDITVDGRSLPRLEEPPQHLGADDSAKMLEYVKAFGALQEGDTIPEDRFRAQEFADEVFTSDFELNDENGSPLYIGDVAYFRPGLGGTMASPAQIYLAAQHFETVVLLYTNMTETDPAFPTELRQVDTSEGILDAVLVESITAPEPLDNIYAVGSAHFTLISYQQQSDTTLEQLELLREGYEEGEFPFDPFEQDDAWIFAHSQATPDSVMTNARLESAGLKPYGTIVSLGSAVYGCRVGGLELWDNATEKARENSGGGDQAAKAYADLVPHTVRTNVARVLGLVDPDEDAPIDVLTERLSEPMRQRIEYSIAPVVQPGPDLPLPPIEEKGDVRTRYYNLGAMEDFEGGDGKIIPNDGLENIDSSAGEKLLVVYSVDHMGIIEAPRHMRATLEFISANEFGEN